MGNSDGIRALRHATAAAGIALLAAPVAAQTRTSGDYRLLSDGLNSAGGTAASADYRDSAAVGGISGSHRSGTLTDQSGYPAGLHEVLAIVFPASPIALDENASVALAVSEWWDDGTWLIPATGTVHWSVESGSSAASVSAGGVLQAHAVSSSTIVLVTARRYEFQVSLTLVVRDSDNDNFAAYAGDGLPDWWQVMHFGFDNPLAAPGQDPDDDGVDNLGEFLALSPPLDARGRLPAEIVAGPDGPSLLFAPVAGGRYRLEMSTGLADWTPAGDAFTVDGGEPVIVPLPVAATGSAGFFRIVGDEPPDAGP